MRSSRDSARSGKGPVGPDARSPLAANAILGSLEMLNDCSFAPCSFAESELLMTGLDRHGAVFPSLLSSAQSPQRQDRGQEVPKVSTTLSEVAIAKTTSDSYEQVVATSHASRGEPSALRQPWCTATVCLLLEGEAPLPSLLDLC